MKLQTENMGIEELSKEEIFEINGGESAWYPVAFYTTHYIQTCNALNKAVFKTFWYSAARCDVAL